MQSDWLKLIMRISIEKRLLYFSVVILCLNLFMTLAPSGIRVKRGSISNDDPNERGMT